MARALRVEMIDTVEKESELVRYLNHQRKVFAFHAFEAAMAAATIKAMLRAHDRVSGVKRAARVARPVGLAAGVLLLVAKWYALAVSRFRTEYAAEIRAGNRKPARRRTLRFGE